MSNYMTDDSSHQKNQPVYSLPNKKHDFCLATSDDDDDGCSWVLPSKYGVQNLSLARAYISIFGTPASHIEK